MGPGPGVGGTGGPSPALAHAMRTRARARAHPPNNRCGRAPSRSPWPAARRKPQKGCPHSQPATHTAHTANVTDRHPPPPPAPHRPEVHGEQHYADHKVGDKLVLVYHLTQDVEHQGHDLKGGQVELVTRCVTGLARRAPKSPGRVCARGRVAAASSCAGLHDEARPRGQRFLQHRHSLLKGAPARAPARARRDTRTAPPPEPLRRVRAP